MCQWIPEALITVLESSNVSDVLFLEFLQQMTVSLTSKHIRNATFSAITIKVFLKPRANAGRRNLHEHEKN